MTLSLSTLLVRPGTPPDELYKPEIHRPISGVEYCEVTESVSPITSGTGSPGSGHAWPPSWHRRRPGR